MVLVSKRHSSSKSASLFSPPILTQTILLLMYLLQYTLFLSSTFCPKSLSRRDISIFLGVRVQFYECQCSKKVFLALKLIIESTKILNFPKRSWPFSLMHFKVWVKSDNLIHSTKFLVSSISVHSFVLQPQYLIKYT